MSSKYFKLYNDIKSKKGIEPNNFVFARNLAGKKAVFLIQNMFLTLETYIIKFVVGKIQQMQRNRHFEYF